MLAPSPIRPRGWCVHALQRDESSGHEEVTSRLMPMSHFRPKWEAINARLRDEMGETPLLSNSFVCLRLYTGLTPEGRIWRTVMNPPVHRLRLPSPSEPP